MASGISPELSGGLSRRGFLRFLAQTAAGAALGARLPGLLAAAASQPGGGRPNIVLILADDLGYECLRCYGGTSYKTPNLDALAEGGVRFTNCFGTPLCTPSRVQLMTGQYPFRTGWTQLIAGPKQCVNPSKIRTFAHVLKDAGYATAVAGKWQLCNFDDHPDHPVQMGFDRYCLWTWQRAKGGKTSRYWNPSIYQDGQYREDMPASYGPDLYCRYLNDFIAENKDRPFLAYYPMTLVHDPFQAPPAGMMDLTGLAGSDHLIASQDKPDRAPKRPNRQANFAAMVEYMDKIVGRIMRTLENNGLLKNTVVIFTSDNGSPREISSSVGDSVIRGGKGQMTDAGTRLPLVVQWQGGIPGGRVADDLVDFSDILPTICDLAGAGLPQAVIDGRSFTPRLLGQPCQGRQWVFSQLGSQRFVRTSRWKLHDGGRLYDVVADPQETHPVAPGSCPEADAARDQLQQVLRQLEQAAGKSGR